MNYILYIFIFVKLTQLHIFQESDYKSVFKKAILKNGYINWTFPIYYYIDKGVYRSKILSVIRYLEKSTCLRFEETQSKKGNMIKYMTSETQCNSLVGKLSRDKEHEIKLTNGCSRNYGDTAHETLHALGLSHEHARKDRDKYITILKGNIDDNLYRNFLKDHDGFTFFDIHYDYSSIMQYPKGAFSKNDRNTMEAKNVEPYNEMMGQSDMITFNDIKHLNYYYCKCHYFNGQCKNGGYVKEPLCGHCICPKEFTGDKCERIADRSENCNLKVYNVTETENLFKGSGNKRCIYHFKTDKDSRIFLNLTYVQTRYRSPCISDVGLEIKYLDDKGTTGLCLCGVYKNILLYSQGNEVVITYTGLESNSQGNEVVITYTGLESSNWFYGYYKKVLKSIKKEDEICYKGKCFIEQDKKITGNTR
uniref:Metalloendopeptidase n=1 Tax=Parastrongyloides trichosuri TaxID=131310 RepID=A0A0N5A6Q6_PARTI